MDYETTNGNNKRRHYTPLEFPSKKEYDRDTVIDILQKAITIRINQLQYLIDEQSSGIYKPGYLSVLYNDSNDCAQAMKYVRANLR